MSDHILEWFLNVLFIFKNRLFEKFYVVRQFFSLTSEKSSYKKLFFQSKNSRMG